MHRYAGRKRVRVHIKQGAAFRCPEQGKSGLATKCAVPCALCYAIRRFFASVVGFGASLLAEQRIFFLNSKPVIFYNFTSIRILYKTGYPYTCCCRARQLSPTAHLCKKKT